MSFFGLHWKLALGACDLDIRLAPDIHAALRTRELRKLGFRTALICQRIADEQPTLAGSEKDQSQSAASSPYRLSLCLRGSR
jgi:hypothetical protein